MSGSMATWSTLMPSMTSLLIYIIFGDQRKRYVLGRKVFSFSYPTTLDEAMTQIAESFYVHYAPKEIRVTRIR